eukprot:CAMPEP_0117427496 /NCGR_PEP_ID=MMETSP0758-20121206/7328_1 /TAXON_ID=63605 /ORGANISM="Percolomonas cosmopolitus, Strain AE-1 (ATCC 50343)" /LENGTH=254 /DNA_ID=CAMNT_0005213159 /DNA_START=150 /DNA_END=911 /DNA_ORIENTATION=+
MREFIDNLSPSDRKILDRLQQLVKLNQVLDTHEAAFHEDRKKFGKEIKEKLDALRAEAQSDEYKQFASIGEQVKEAEGKLKKIQAAHAKKARDIVALQRQIDEIPMRAELNQYEKRFAELFDQIVTKLDETKIYYAKYNTLQHSYTYLEREMKLLTDIQGYFEKSLKSNKKYKVWIKTTVERIVEEIENKEFLVKQELERFQEERDNTNAKYMQHVSQQRAYFRAVKAFQKAAQDNDKYRETLKTLQRRIQELK